MAKSQKRAVGDIGEGIASKYLLSRGFEILERNYWRPWGEIDIVARRNGSLVFVEVKSVTVGVSRETIRPEENLHYGKAMRLSRVIQTYLADKNIPESQEWRVDLACVYLDFDRRKGRVEVFEGVL